MAGKVYLIGAGPGQPDLITVRGLAVLKQAEVVIYDYLVGEKLIGFANKNARLICSHTLGKLPYHANMANAQERINKLLVKEARKNKKVVRLKNGDASIFSRIAEELAVLTANKIEYEIVPGVTAASAAAAYCGIPLTSRGIASNVVFVTGHGSKKESIDWIKLAQLPSLVLYMAVSKLPEIIDNLIALGKPAKTPVAMISCVGQPKQQLVKGTLADIVKKVKQAKIKPPALVIIGETVRLECRFNWLRKNKRILFTGLSEERFFLSGTYFHVPMIEIQPLADYSQLDHWLKSIGVFNWLVFSSRYGVQYFFERLFALGLDVRALAGIKIAAVGKSSAKALLNFGVKADVVPKIESADGLSLAMKKQKIDGQNIFMPRSNLADKGLEQKLARLGARVTSCVAYNNVMPENLPALDLAFFDEIMFTSPSAVRNFKKRYKKVPKGVKISWIGDVTKKEVKRVFKK